MNKQSWEHLEDFMFASMLDSAHDRQHVYRVLQNAIEIARDEENVNMDVLMTAALLHDIARADEREDPSLDPAASIEAKILFDADKLDVCGAIGIARTLMYSGAHDRPIYTTNPDGSIRDGKGDTEDSFFREYRFKLEGMYDRFLTRRGAELAKVRKPAAVSFYDALLREISTEEKWTPIESLLTDE